jgi:hypothetical protein
LKEGSEPSVPQTSVPERATSFSIFGRSLVLPFAKPVHSVLSGGLPCALIATLSFYFGGWTVVGGANYNGGVRILYPLSIASQRAPLPLFIWLTSFFLLACWLCTWQRAVALQFTEPLGRWLKESSARVPGYAVAFFLWLGGALTAYTLPLAVLGYGLAALGLPAESEHADPTELLLWELATMLFAFWIMGRFAAFPALVAVRGWRGSIGEAWKLSSGRGFGLSLGFLTCFGLGIVIGSIFAGELGDAYPFADWLPHVIGFANIVVTTLTLIWFTSMGGFLARLGLDDATLNGADAAAAVFD